MGNSCIRKFDLQKSFRAGEGNLRSLRFLKRIKANKLSTIWLVEECDNNQTLRALKVTDKLQLCRRNCQQLPINEQKILRKLNHPLLANIVASFQDEEALYILLEYMPYGSLQDYIALEGVISQESLKFVASCLFLSLGYLHSKGFVHLDIKPDNILIDEKKYLRLCDFNLSQPISSLGNFRKGVGSLGYRAPEILNRAGNVGFEADYFSAGVVLYELLTGKNIQNSLAMKPQDLKKDLERLHLSKECISFIGGLLEKDPRKRLGSEGTSSILTHPWLSHTEKSISHYQDKSAASIVSDSYISKYCIIKDTLEAEDNQSLDDDEMVKKVFIQEPEFQRLFARFKTIDRQTAKAM